MLYSSHSDNDNDELMVKTTFRKCTFTIYKMLYFGIETLPHLEKSLSAFLPCNTLTIKPIPE